MQHQTMFVLALVVVSSAVGGPYTLLGGKSANVAELDAERTARMEQLGLDGRGYRYWGTCRGGTGPGRNTSLGPDRENVCACVGGRVASKLEPLWDFYATIQMEEALQGQAVVGRKPHDLYSRSRIRSEERSGSDSARARARDFKSRNRVKRVLNDAFRFCRARAARA